MFAYPPPRSALASQPLPVGTQGEEEDPKHVMMSAGFCVAYLVFIAQNLEPMTGYRGVYFILGACPIVAAITMLTGVRALAPFSLIADVANVLGGCPPLPFHPLFTRPGAAQGI